MKRDLSQVETCLILSMRHLGDAVIIAGFINALSSRYTGIVVDILGREDLKAVTQELCTVHEYIPVDFPLFGHHKRDAAAVHDALKKISLLRKRKYECCINLMGDLRENTIGRMVGAKEVISPVWPNTHPFRRHIRTVDLSGWLADKTAVNPVPVAGYYASIESFARQIGLGGLSWPVARGTQPRQGKPPTIGIHPGASDPSKQWPVAKWRELIRRLYAQDFRLKIYGSPTEADGLRHDFATEIDAFAIEVVTSDMAGFLESLITLDLLVCMDSFSSHAGHAVGLPTVVLHGPFDPVVMTPPSGIPLSAGSQCGVFPCYKGSSCSNMKSQYICVRGIEVEAVVRAAGAAISCRERTANR